MKKIIALALACMMICGLFCSAAVAEGDPITINWFRVAWHSNVDEEMVETAINEYIEPLIGVNVNIMNDAESAQLDLSLAAGEDIDLYWSASWSNGYNYIRNKAAMDLTDLLPNYPALVESIPDNVWEAAKVEGRNYYLPNYKETAVGYGVCTPKRIVDEFGWDLSGVKELRDLTPFLQEAYDAGFEWAWNTHVQYFYCYCLDDYALINNWIGIGTADDTNTVVNLQETPEFLDFVTMMREWNEAGFINPENLGAIGDQAVEKEYRAENQTAFGQWTLVPDDVGNCSNNAGEEMVVLPITEHYLNTDGPFGSAYMVNYNTPDYDACLKFVEVLFTDTALANLVTFGIEGKHYNINEEGRVDFVPDSGYSYPGVWICTNVMAPTLCVGEAEDKKEQYAIFNETSPVCKLAGFLFDPSNVTAEVSTVDGVIAEYRDLIEKGFYDPAEYLGEYNDALKAAGIDTVIAEAQAQVDAFFAAK